MASDQHPTSVDLTADQYRLFHQNFTLSWNKETQRSLDQRWAEEEHRLFRNTSQFFRAWLLAQQTQQFGQVFHTVFLIDGVNSPPPFRNNPPLNYTRFPTEPEGFRERLTSIHPQSIIWSTRLYLQEADQPNSYMSNCMYKLYDWPTVQINPWVTSCLETFRENHGKFLEYQPRYFPQHQVNFRLPSQRQNLQIVGRSPAVHKTVSVSTYGEVMPPSFIDPGIAPDGETDVLPPKFVHFERLSVSSLRIPDKFDC